MTATRIVHLLPSWEYVGAVRRIGMLAGRLDTRAYQHEVVALRALGPCPQSIGQFALANSALATGRRLGLALAWRLRRLICDRRPDVVHVWSGDALGIARAAVLGIRGVRLIAASAARLPPGVDVMRLRNEINGDIPRHKLFDGLDLPASALLLGTAGRLTREKQVIELLWALDQIRCVREDVYLLVIGDGNARQMFERYARLYEIAGRVRFLGWRCDAAALIARLDAYCTASLQPYGSLAMLEAMALGVPVVAADTPAHRRFIVNSETGFLVDIGQRSEMARWCLRVLEDKTLAQRLSAEARRRVSEQYGIEPFVKECQRLYDERPAR